MEGGRGDTSGVRTSSQSPTECQRCWIDSGTMTALLEGLLGSLAASPAEDSEISGSFQSEVRDYDYGGSGVVRNDHYGGHSGYHPEGISFP